VAARFIIKTTNGRATTDMFGRAMRVPTVSPVSTTKPAVALPTLQRPPTRC